MPRVRSTEKHLAATSQPTVPVGSQRAGQGVSATGSVRFERAKVMAESCGCTNVSERQAQYPVPERQTEPQTNALVLDGPGRDRMRCVETPHLN
jgi:hypothetical protein